MGNLAQLTLRGIRSLANGKSSGPWPPLALGVDRFIVCHLHGSPFTVPETANEMVREAVAAIKRNGFHAIPNFISQDQCADLRARIDAAIENVPEMVHPATPWDLRLHGIENIDEAFRFFSADPALREFASACLGEPARTAFTLGARLEPKPGNPGSGGGWHRDGSHRQMKSMVYLSDVAEENGPFQLLADSEKLFQSIRDDAIAAKNYGEVRWTEEQVERVLAETGKGRLKTLTGSAGTLLLFDSSTIHRGMPIRQGTRYAMTNYFYKERDITPEVYAHFAPVAGFTERNAA